MSHFTVNNSDIFLSTKHFICPLVPRFGTGIHGAILATLENLNCTINTSHKNNIISMSDDTVQILGIATDRPTCASFEGSIFRAITFIFGITVSRIL